MSKEQSQKNLKKTRIDEYLLEGVDTVIVEQEQSTFLEDLNSTGKFEQTNNIVVSNRDALNENKDRLTYPNIFFLLIYSLL